MRGSRVAIARWIACRRGVSAVEFSIILPLFLAILFGIISFGAYIAVVHGVQQLAAEAARAAVGGLSDDERVKLAKANIEANVTSYPLITPTRLTLQSAATDAGTSVFSVTVRYDGSDMFIFSLPRFLPVPDPSIVRSAAIQRGGY